MAPSFRLHKGRNSQARDERNVHDKSHWYVRVCDLHGEAGHLRPKRSNPISMNILLFAKIRLFASAPTTQRCTESPPQTRKTLSSPAFPSLNLLAATPRSRV